MAAPWLVLMSSGGLRSLIAAATVRDHPHVAVLYIHDGRPNDQWCYAAAAAQVEHFQCAKLLELHMHHLAATADTATSEPGVGPRVPLSHAQLLIAASTIALQLKAKRLIWPVSVGEDFDAVARVTETVELLNDLTRLDQGVDLVIDTPLVELTGAQLLDLGHQMQVPWELSRSCESPSQHPCGGCPGCHRRREMFETSGVEDPIAVVH